MFNSLLVSASFGKQVLDWLPLNSVAVFVLKWYRDCLFLQVHIWNRNGQKFLISADGEKRLMNKPAQMFFHSPMQDQLSLTVHPRLLIFFFSFFCHNIQLAITCTNTSKLLKLETEKQRFFFPFYDIIPGTLQKSVLFYSSSLCVQRMIETWHHPSTKRSFRVSPFHSIVKYCWTALPWSRETSGDEGAPLFYPLLCFLFLFLCVLFSL